MFLRTEEARAGNWWEVVRREKRKFGPMEESREVELKVGKIMFEKEGIFRGRTRL